MTTLTVTGALRLRNAREHRALEGLWSWCNELRNALCEQHLGGGVQPARVPASRDAVEARRHRVGARQTAQRVPRSTPE